MRIPINREADTPLYTQITNFLRQQISNGALTAETRLPPSRELAADLGVSRVTVINAYAELEADGLLVSHQGSGTFVAAPIHFAADQVDTAVTWPHWQEEIATQANIALFEQYEQHLRHASHPDLISFTAGMATNELFDVHEFRKSVQAVLQRDGADALVYGDSKYGGYAPLRTTIAQILSSSGIPARPENVLITSGSQQAITIAANLLLRPGDTVLVEAPTYSGALDQFKLCGAAIVGIPMDEEGMRMDSLEEALHTTNARLIYTIPTFHVPTGISLSTQRRQQMITLAQAANVPIIEDDFAGDLRYDGHAQPALKALDTNGTVIYVNTFSKALVPGLRIGFMLANGPVYEHLLIHKRTGDRASSELMQRALDAYISVGRYQSHLRKVCRTYRQRRDAMLAALTEFMPNEMLWQRPSGGIFIWVTLPQGLDADELLKTALAEGVAFVPGSVFYADKRPSNALRLNFTDHPPHRIREGIRRLAKAINSEIEDLWS